MTSHTLDSLPPELHAAALAAAVLEAFDRDALGALIEAPAAPAIEELAEAGVAVAAGEGYALADPWRVGLGTDLAADPERASRLHGRAARHYAARLPASEPEFMRHLEQR